MNYKTSISGRATSCINLQIKDFSKGKFLVSTCKEDKAQVMENAIVIYLQR